MEFKELFANYKKTIKEKLLETIDLKKADYEKRFGENDEFFTIFKNFTVSGKMIRGSLFLLSCESNGYKIDDSLLSIACSLELMHSALLIHDDIMDNDELRRGEKTIFTKYKEIAIDRNIKNPEHYGLSMGIVTGDIALFMAEELVSNYEKANLKKVLEFYTQELRFVGIGQMLDFRYGAEEREVSAYEIERMYIYKSARYTFSLPLAMGAIAAGKNDDFIKKIEKLGETIGLIFQLVDDDIGIFGDEEEIGKPIGSDIKENKKTLMRSLLINKIDDEKKDLVEEIFGKQNITEGEIEIIRNLLIESGTREDIKVKINDLYKESEKIIASLDLTSEYKKVYLDLLEYNTKRIY